MRILWVCNIMLPVIAESLGQKASSREGWLSGLAETILGRHADNQITLGICFPIQQKGELLQGNIRGTAYYGFYENVAKETEYEVTLDIAMQKIMSDFRPDMIHIFGTEFPHALSAAKTFANPERTLVGIQGVCIACARHYMDGIPLKVQQRSTFRDMLKQDNISQQQERFAVRARNESHLLQLVGHVTGRTSLDQEAAARINGKLQYHFMNETLRADFYKAEWHLDACAKYSIFLSQGDYPLKGFHYMLQALPLIKQEYPKVHLSVAGNRITGYHTLKEKLKISSYGKYLRQLIREGNLEENITFLGMIDSKAMCEQMLNSHVLVSPSTMENSPNSVGEAMLLGLPVVSSDAGGVKSILTDGEDGLLYPVKKPELLAQNVCRLWKEEGLAERLSEHARKHARQTHNPEENYKRLLEIYQAVCGGSADRIEDVL